MSKTPTTKLKKTSFPKVKVRGRGRSHTLNLLFFDWPVTRIVLNKLIAFLTIILPPKEAESAAQTIVEEALQAYSQSVYHLNIHKNPDPERIRFFIDAVIGKTCEVLQEANITIHSINSLQRSLYELLTSEQLKTVLKESISEKAIMDGVVVSNDPISRTTGSSTK